jgi:hypothetical protein
MTITQYRREISPAYETIGKRRRLAGYEATLIDADGTIIHCQDYPTHHDAEVALDQRVYDLLNDQSSVAPVCPTCGGEGDCPDCDPLPDLATDLYNVVCLTLSGAAATTAISELRRVQARYEKAQQELEKVKAELNEIPGIHL